MQRLVIILTFVGLSAFAADPVNTNRLPWTLTWSNYVGVTGGIPPVSQVTSFTGFTATATAAQVNNALANCPSNQAVDLAAGTYSFGGTQIIMQKNGVVLRGATNANGFPTTILNDSSDPTIQMGASGFDTSTTTGWSTVNVNSGATRGSTTVTLASIPTGCAARSLLWFSAPPGGVVDGGSFALFLGTNPYCQIVEVTSVSGNDVSFWPPLAGPWATKASTRTANTSYVRMGIENIKFGGANLTYIRVEGTSECWIKNCQITNSPNGSVRQIWLYTPSRTEIRHCIFGTINADGSDAYSIFGQDASGTLVVDNIFKDAPNFFPQMGATYMAFVYNYATNCPYNQVPGWLSQIVYNHGAFNNYCLYEGNHYPTCYDDGLDNNPNDPSVQFCMTHLREVVTGWDGSDGGKIYNCRAFTFLEPSYSNNVVNCILGRSGFHDQYAPTSFTSETKAIFDIPTPISSNSIARFSNWNAVDNGIRAFENAYTGTIVNSYLYASKPAFFGTLSWPPYSGSNVTAASTSPTNIPAGYRFVFGADVPAQSDSTPPTITITGPTSATTFSTNNSSVAISGTASDETALSSVTYVLTGATSGSGTASGTTSWSFTASELNPGDTVVTVTATDTSSNTAQDVLTITYSPTATFRPVGRIGRVGP